LVEEETFLFFLSRGFYGRKLKIAPNKNKVKAKANTHVCIGLVWTARYRKLSDVVRLGPCLV
jgi:hypothetical protein